MPVSPDVQKLRALAKTQLFVMDLPLADAPALLAGQFGGPDLKQPVVWRDAESGRAGLSEHHPTTGGRTP